MKTVMVVDDSLFIRKVVSEMLTQASLEVVAQASDGEEAFELYTKWHPDLVIMDITMPHVDGIEGIKRIFHDFPEARVIMCSAMGQQRLINQSILLGAKDFIVKPFQKDNLLRVVLNVLQ